MTHDQLLHALHYEPLTGVFTWKNPLSARVKVGDVAGNPNKNGHLRLQVRGEQWMVNRLAIFYVTGVAPAPDVQIDHEDRVRDNNAFKNLRPGSHAFNQQNRSVLGEKGSVSGRLGVSFHPKSGLWRARATVNGREQASYHEMLDDAASAAIAMRVKHYPGFVAKQFDVSALS